MLCASEQPMSPPVRRREKTWNKEDVMKTIVSALIALAVLAGVAAPAGAGLDAKKFFAQLDRSRF